MSDPVTNTEIEDVLTSIRRLVSENRPLAETSDKSEEPALVAVETAAPEPEAFENDEASLALVLTPALRVAEDEDSPEPALILGEAKSEDVLDADEAFDTQTEALDEGVPETTDSADETLSADEANFEETASDEDISEFVQEDEAELETEVATVEAEETGDALEDDGATFAAEHSVEDVVAQVDEDIDEEQPFDFKQVLEARIHQFRDAESAEEVQLNVPADVSPEMADAVMDELRVSMPDEIAEATELPAAGSLSAAMDEAMEIDEAILREMVADIVRQELQGALGERITRNVRKLVRREIHRALAAHDLG